jgi:hypothetical protein
MQFTQARPIIDKIGVPVIDLLDTFAASKNLIEFRVSRDDLHFNARGHEMILENLYHKITQDRKLSAFVLGTHEFEALRRAAALSPASPRASHGACVAGKGGRVVFVNLICDGLTIRATKEQEEWQTKSERKSGNTF